MKSMLKLRLFLCNWSGVSLSCHSIETFSEGDGHEPPILPSRLEAPQDRQDNVFILFYVMFVYYCCLDENGLRGRTGLGTTLIFNIHMRHDAAHIIYFDM